MDEDEDENVTAWLAHVGIDESARQKLFNFAYEALHKAATHLMNKERADHTLQPTALINELFLRLFEGNEAGWENRGHFMAVATLAMKRILVDHARARGRLKRGGGTVHVPLSLKADGTRANERAYEGVHVADALDQLANLDVRMSEVARLKIMSDLTNAEIAEVTKISARTVVTEWKVARMILCRLLDLDEH